MALLSAVLGQCLGLMVLQHGLPNSAGQVHHEAAAQGSGLRARQWCPAQRPQGTDGCLGLLGLIMGGGVGSRRGVSSHRNMSPSVGSVLLSCS
jgi:hypothetical protein